MLPIPSSSRSKYHRPYPHAHSQISPATSSLINTLRTRTRLTNLAVAILISTLTLSLLLNFSHYFSTPQPTYPYNSFRTRLKSTNNNAPGDGQSWDVTQEQLEGDIPLSIETTIERVKKYAELTHLIVVPGHALWTGSDPKTWQNDEDWVLEPMQKGGSVKTFVKHIREAIDRLKDDNNALLVFSGGATRPPPAPLLTESQTYLRLAHALSLLPSTPISTPYHESPLPLNLRATTEEYALDSYQNLLFSIARFHEVTTKWPKKITVVGYGMKRRRFEQLHRVAIGYPFERFYYIGIDDEGDTTEHYAGELKYGFTPFLSSPSGCHPPLSTKKLLRNPFTRVHPYHTSVPELVDLFEWCPPLQTLSAEDEAAAVNPDGIIKGLKVFEGEVPWRDAVTRWDRERD